MPLSGPIIDRLMMLLRLLPARAKDDSKRWLDVSTARSIRLNCVKVTPFAFASSRSKRDACPCGTLREATRAQAGNASAARCAVSLSRFAHAVAKIRLNFGHHTCVVLSVDEEGPQNAKKPAKNPWQAALDWRFSSSGERRAMQVAQRKKPAEVSGRVSKRALRAILIWCRHATTRRARRQPVASATAVFACGQKSRARCRAVYVASMSRGPAVAVCNSLKLNDSRCDMARHEKGAG